MSKKYTEPQIFVPNGDVSELIIDDIRPGDGEEVKETSRVEVHYHGNLASDGSIFDSSYKRGEPIQFSLNEVIEGWQKGLVGMKVGGARRLVIPSNMAYGERGAGSAVPPNADLVFYVELIGILN